MLHVLPLLGLFGCSTNNAADYRNEISTTGSDRIALFKDGLRTDINPHFDDTARQEIDKANFDQDKPDRVEPGEGPPPSFTAQSFFVSDSCSGGEVIIDKELLKQLLLPEEGGLDCLIVDAPAAYVGCIRSPYETIKMDQFPVGSIKVGYSKPDKFQSASLLVLTHATIIIREENRFREISINVMSCPNTGSLEVCLFDYSPKKFVSDIIHKRPLTYTQSQSLSLASTDSQIVTKVIQDMQLDADGRVLGIIARKREASPGIKICGPLEFYTIN